MLLSSLFALLCYLLTQTCPAASPMSPASPMATTVSTPHIRPVLPRAYTSPASSELDAGSGSGPVTMTINSEPSSPRQIPQAALAPDSTVPEGAERPGLLYGIYSSIFGGASSSTANTGTSLSPAELAKEKQEVKKFSRLQLVSSYFKISDETGERVLTAEEQIFPPPIVGIPEPVQAPSNANGYTYSSGKMVSSLVVAGPQMKCSLFGSAAADSDILMTFAEMKMGSKTDLITLVAGPNSETGERLWLEDEDYSLNEDTFVTAAGDECPILMPVQTFDGLRKNSQRSIHSQVTSLTESLRALNLQDASFADGSGPSTALLPNTNAALLAPEGFYSRCPQGHIGCQVGSAFPRRLQLNDCPSALSVKWAPRDSQKAYTVPIKALVDNFEYLLRRLNNRENLVVVNHIPVISTLSCKLTGGSRNLILNIFGERSGDSWENAMEAVALKRSTETDACKRTCFRKMLPGSGSRNGSPSGNCFRKCWQSRGGRTRERASSGDSNGSQGSGNSGGRAVQPQCPAHSEVGAMEFHDSLRCTPGKVLPSALQVPIWLRFPMLLLNQQISKRKLLGGGPLVNGQNSDASSSKEGRGRAMMRKMGKKISSKTSREASPGGSLPPHEPMPQPKLEKRASTADAPATGPGESIPSDLLQSLEIQRDDSESGAESGTGSATPAQPPSSDDDDEPNGQEVERTAVIANIPSDQVVSLAMIPQARLRIDTGIGVLNWLQKTFASKLPSLIEKPMVDFLAGAGITPNKLHLALFIPTVWDGYVSKVQRILKSRLMELQTRFEEEQREAIQAQIAKADERMRAQMEAEAAEAAAAADGTATVKPVVKPVSLGPTSPRDNEVWIQQAMKARVLEKAQRSAAFPSIDVLEQEFFSPLWEQTVKSEIKEQLSRSWLLKGHADQQQLKQTQSDLLSAVRS